MHESMIYHVFNCSRQWNILIEPVSSVIQNRFIIRRLADVNDEGHLASVHPSRPQLAAS